MKPITSQTIAHLGLAGTVERYVALAEPYIMRIGERVRDDLNARGLLYAGPEAEIVAAIHAGLHECLPGVIAESAATLLLCFSHHGEIAQETFDEAMTMALALFAGVVRLCFEEFGPVDEAALEATMRACQTALLARFQVLADATTSEGHA